MNQPSKSPSELSGSPIDWRDPRLQSLLSKSDGWSLDNRGVFTPIPCELHVGWGAGTGKPATLVFERNGVMVVEAGFIMPKGERVRVDQVKFGTLRSTWGAVVDGRAGNRAEDLANGTHVYWIHVQ